MHVIKTTKQLLDSGDNGSLIAPQNSIHGPATADIERFSGGLGVVVHRSGDQLGQQAQIPPNRPDLCQSQDPPDM